TYASWLWWVCSYFHVQQWGGHLEQTGFDQGTAAMMRAFLQEVIPVKTMLKPFTFLAALNIFTGALWFLLGAFFVGLRSLWVKQYQTIWVALLWLLAFVPFFIWWEPWNIEFWVSSTAPCWILMAVVVSNLSNIFEQPVLHLANRTIVIALWAGIISL